MDRNMEIKGQGGTCLDRVKAGEAAGVGLSMGQWGIRARTRVGISWIKVR